MTETLFPIGTHVTIRCITSNYNAMRGIVRDRRREEGSGGWRFFVDVKHEDDRRRGGWFYRWELEPVSVKPESASIGTNVTVNSIASRYHGQRGIIIRKMETEAIPPRSEDPKVRYLVELPLSKRRWFSPSELCSNDEARQEEKRRLKDQLKASIELEKGIEKYKRVSPLTVQILMAIYVSPKSANETGCGVMTTSCWHSPAATAARLWLRQQGLINEAEEDLTDKGRAWFEAILSTPLPVAKWEIAK